MQQEISEIFGYRPRIRVCGLCWRNDHLLLVNHRGLRDGNFWAPPGGGVDFGASLEDTLIKEFSEETGLRVAIGQLRFVTEFINPPLHAVEVFFDINEIGGTLSTGYDPELAAERQLIVETRFLSVPEIVELHPDERHGLFRVYNTEIGLKTAFGYCRI